MNTATEDVKFDYFKSPTNAEHWLQLELNVGKACAGLGISRQWAEMLYRNLLLSALKPDRFHQRLDTQRFFDVTARYFLYRELCVIHRIVNETPAELREFKHTDLNDNVQLAIFVVYSAINATFDHIKDLMNVDGWRAIYRLYGEHLVRSFNRTGVFAYRVAYYQALDSKLKHLGWPNAIEMEKLWLDTPEKNNPNEAAWAVSKEAYARFGRAGETPKEFPVETPLPKLPDITLAQFTAMLPTTVSALDIARVTADRSTFNVLEVSLLAKRIIEGE